MLMGVDKNPFYREAEYIKINFMCQLKKNKILVKKIELIRTPILGAESIKISAVNQLRPLNNMNFLSFRPQGEISAPRERGIFEISRRCRSSK